ncbi:hypothetical protein [Vibrio coralliilyticus]|uniref:hypothetical protein n=1 Tax=Vibrio coralliilyticus TaxID=190893 RepID=UPI000BAAD110|nr:hypothetical protein [Vibrio coralliilyticus]NOI32123.1 hypothetical protein [Vibrio coralliilyticus]NOI51282.1 hypothetical protein [Vibrio coralliilyticus]NOI60785.1 hypothetical protein [Vibrio coralliilyticus]PAT65315.1 hypothetical protein CKA27_25220 [Vibrio coralliilyticus]
MDIIGIGLSIIGILLSLYTGSRNKRLLEKAERYKEKIEMYEAYSSKSGHKVIAIDSFQYISYALAVYIFSESLIKLPDLFPLNAIVAYVLVNLAVGAQLGAALILLGHFSDIEKSKNKNKFIPKLESKLEKVKHQLNPKV